MLQIIKDFIKQEFDIKNKPYTTYRNYIFIICVLTFAAISINNDDQVTIFYSFLWISLIYLVFFLLFHDDKPETKEKKIITYEVKNSESNEFLSEIIGKIIGCSTLAISIYLLIMLYNYLGFFMFIIVMILGAAIVLPIIFAFSLIISVIGFIIAICLILYFIFY